jgi:aspartyl protease family protein
MKSVRQRLLWFGFGGLLIGLASLTLHYSRDNTPSLSQPDLALLIGNVALLLFVGSTVMVFLRDRLARMLPTALMWLVVVLMLLVGYAYRFELHSVGERVLSELLPGRAFSHGRTVEIARAVGGDFDVGTRINGARVAMVLDTGASSVILTREDAKAAGLPLEVLAYTASVDTANGRTLAAPVTLDRLAVGALVEHSVSALVVQPGLLRTSLLGMSFLNRLQSWEVRGDRLLLRGYP